MTSAVIIVPLWYEFQPSNDRRSHRKLPDPRAPEMSRNGWMPNSQLLWSSCFRQTSHCIHCASGIAMLLTWHSIIYSLVSEASLNATLFLTKVIKLDISGRPLFGFRAAWFECGGSRRNSRSCLEQLAMNAIVINALVGGSYSTLSTMKEYYCIAADCLVRENVQALNARVDKLTVYWKFVHVKLIRTSTSSVSMHTLINHLLWQAFTGTEVGLYLLKKRARTASVEKGDAMRERVRVRATGMLADGHKRARTYPHLAEASTQMLEINDGEAFTTH